MVKRKTLKFAIHHRSESFSERWIEYCEENCINYELVDCYSFDIVNRLKYCDALLWNWSHASSRDVQVATSIISAAEKMGLAVFPSSTTCQTFDNKVAQKYQMESVGAPLIPTYVFYDQSSAIEWLEQTSLPKVFKLSRGASSLNVRLVKNLDEGKALVKKAFYCGFKNSTGHVKKNVAQLSSKCKGSLEEWNAKFMRLPKTLHNIYRLNKTMGREIGYVYFQDFIPRQTFDTRVVVIGERILAFRRFVRENDFRASGSGMVDFNPDAINKDALKVAYETSFKLDLQCAAYDFVEDESGNPLIIEISYTFPSGQGSQLKDCPGYWDKNLTWHQGRVWAQDAIISDLLKTLGVADGG